MAWMVQFLNISLEAGADLTGRRNRLLAIGTDGRVVVASVPANPIVGVLLNEPKPGQAATVCVSGVAKVVSGAAFAAGANLATNADGKAVALTAGNYCIGMALEAATAADQVVTMLITHAGL